MALKSASFVLRFLLALIVLTLLACASGSPGARGGKPCLDCHADYRQRFSQGIVHLPVKQENCGACHRGHGLIGGVYLNSPEPALCFQCHRDMGKALEGMKNQHKPVKDGKCDSCHEFHNAPEPALLKAKGDAICFTCHDRQAFTRKNVHKPVADGCKTCHQTHGSNFPELLGENRDVLCQRCHKIDAAEFQARHGDYPVTTGCTDCHDVHSTDNAGLLRTRVHVPVIKGECRNCHAGDVSDSSAINAQGSGLCFGCHSNLKAAFSGAGVHGPAAKGECGGCHHPHASDYRGMVKRDPAKLCFECHKFKHLGPNVSVNEGNVHAPAAQGNCLACHDAHLPTVGQPALLRKPAEKLCLDCHAEIASPKIVGHQPAREGRCMTCHTAHESEVRGILVQDQRTLCGECHQSVDVDMGRSSLHRPFVVGDCATCHNPHGASQQKLLVSTGVGLCAGCHQKVEAERKNARRHRPFTEGRCALCHDSHASDQPFLLTGAVDSLCVSCHPGRKVSADVPIAHQNCTICHRTHGNDEKNYLLQEQPALCVNCHKINDFWEKGVGHPPAVKGECGKCHDPHNPQKKKPIAELCVGCHKLDVVVLAKNHKGITPGRESCLGCHDPHGGPDRALTLPIKHVPFADGDCKACHSGGQQ